MRPALLALGCLLLATVLSAAERSPGADVLILTGAVDPASDTSRSRAKIQWLRQEEEGHYSLGVERSRVGQSSWLVAEAGGSRRIAPRWRLSGVLSGGPGDGPSGDFSYALANLGATYAWRPGELFMEASIKAFDIDQTTGRLGQVGMTWVARPAAIASWKYTASFNSRERVEFLTARVDFPRQRLPVFIGATVGETVPALIDPGSGDNSAAIDYRQAFLGARQEVGSLVLDFIVEREEIDGRSRVLVGSSLRLPWPALRHRQRP